MTSVLKVGVLRIGNLLCGLDKAGVRLKRLRFGGIAYHLWHKKVGRERLDINKALANQSVISHSVRCKEGYDGHKEAT